MESIRTSKKQSKHRKKFWNIIRENQRFRHEFSREQLQEVRGEDGSTGGGGAGVRSRSVADKRNGIRDRVRVGIRARTLSLHRQPHRLHLAFRVVPDPQEAAGVRTQLRHHRSRFTARNLHSPGIGGCRELQANTGFVRRGAALLLLQGSFSGRERRG